MVKFRAAVDRKKCVAFGACVELCPEYFYLSDWDGKSKIDGGKEIVEDDQNVIDVIEVDDVSCLIDRSRYQVGIIWTA